MGASATDVLVAGNKVTQGNTAARIVRRIIDLSLLESDVLPLTVEAPTKHKYRWDSEFDNLSYHPAPFDWLTIVADIASIERVEHFRREVKLYLIT